MLKLKYSHISNQPIPVYCPNTQYLILNTQYSIHSIQNIRSSSQPPLCVYSLGTHLELHSRLAVVLRTEAVVGAVPPWYEGVGGGAHE